MRHPSTHSYSEIESLTDTCFVYFRFIMVKLDTEGLHHLAKDMFAQLDIDGSGELTLTEFKQIITQLDVGFTLDEIGQLVKELGMYD